MDRTRLSGVTTNHHNTNTNNMEMKAKEESGGDAMSGSFVLVSADDGSLPVREELFTYRGEFVMQEYYESIKAWTFPTAFMDLTLEQVQGWRKYNRGSSDIDKKELVFVQQIEQGIDAAIKQVYADNDNNNNNKAQPQQQQQPEHQPQQRPVFVRLATRSPKDAVEHIPERLAPLILERLIEQMPTPGSAESIAKLKADPNRQLIALRHAFFDAMSVKSGKEAMQLIMYSMRAVSDLKRAVDAMEKREKKEWKNAEWNMKVIVRRFVRFPIVGELRGFVFNKNLTALSQYYCDCYFSQLQSKEVQERIVRMVRNLFDRVKGVIALSNYIVDFAVDLENDRIYIVELNPFALTTGSCLFDWIKDKQVIEKGPFEFRVLTKPINAEAALIPWQHLIDEGFRVLEQRSLSHSPQVRIGSNGHVLSARIALLVLVFAIILMLW